MVYSLPQLIVWIIVGSLRTLLRVPRKIKKMHTVSLRGFVAHTWMR